ncbi:LysR family transcriptional regulator [Photobacterium aquae]|uniref:LysR family transcriptional regulator n=1 Tax=Photobacterium aquae TaxID=1195763 RepID=A0A0J1HB60_9GAMM|nr:LysR family transcriptional regulator [Photobacterium aquae]KLV08879.1 LysR family transcriptional regulator [Photobacterium aquae]
MKIHQLEMFLETCIYGSIAEAARRLGKSRTTVSASINALEDQLGVTLLHRTGNQVILTEIGEAIKNDCERMVMIAGDIRAKCSQSMAGIESAIRIARDDALPEPFWRQLITEMSLQFPTTNVSVYVAPPPELHEMVSDNMVDVAYCLLPMTDTLPHNHHHILGQIRMMSVVHSSHPLSKLSRIISADLARYTEFTLSAIEDDNLVAVAPASSNYIALPFYEHLRNAVLDGTGWSTVPSVLINPYLRSGELKVLNHYRAMKWQPYGMIVGQNTNLGTLNQWLSGRLEQYLNEASL